MTDNKVKGFAIKERNDTRIAVGVHRDGLDSLLSMFSVSNELRNRVLADCTRDWVNVSFIRRDVKHPAGFSHFVVKGGLENG